MWDRTVSEELFQRVGQKMIKMFVSSPEVSMTWDPNEGVNGQQQDGPTLDIATARDETPS
jgi:hypothetical protein